MKLVVAVVAFLAALPASAADLPGTTGPLRYFVSTDDASKLYLVDWKLDGKDLGLLLLEGRASTEADKVTAHERRTRQGEHVIYAAGRDFSRLVLADGDGRTMYEGTARKTWTLTDSSNGQDQTNRYVEIPPPTGTRTAAQVVEQYVKSEGAAKVTDAAPAKADIEKTVNAACGGKVNAKVDAAAKAGMAERARVTGQAIAGLCADADYKAALAKVTELKFVTSAKAETTTTLKGKSVEVAFGTNPVNTPATVSLWLKNNL